MTSWILLSDVGEDDGPTKVVPLSVGESVPYWPDTLDGSANDYVTNYLPAGAFADEEISVTGSAGTLFSFRTDIVHRGSHMTAERSARFTPLAHYDVWGPRWTGRVGWAAHSLSAEWGESSSGRLPVSGRCSGSRLRATSTGTSRPWPTPKRTTPVPISRLTAEGARRRHREAPIRLVRSGRSRL